MKLKPNPKYIPLVQMEMCCVPSTLQWIMLRRGLPLIDQEEIAKFFKMHIPAKLNKFFQNKFPNTKCDWGNYGSPTTNENLNEFLKKYKYPLKANYIHISEIKDPKKLLIENMKTGNDVAILFQRLGIGRGGDNGHMSVIAEFDTQTEQVTIGDPIPHHPKYWKVKLSKLVDAMTNKWDGKERGFIFVSSK